MIEQKLEQADKIDAASKLIKVFIASGDSFSTAKRKALDHVGLTDIQVRYLMDSCDYILTRKAFLMQHTNDRRWVKN